MIEVAPTADTAAPFAIRRAVFVAEQGIPEAEEFDDRDTACTHLLATDAGRPVGTARLWLDGTEGRIGRVAVLAEARGRGVGARLVGTALGLLRDGGAGRVRLSAQTRATGLYRRLGFVEEGGIYDDAGIPHIDMVRDL